MISSIRVNGQKVAFSYHWIFRLSPDQVRVQTQEVKVKVQRSDVECSRVMMKKGVMLEVVALLGVGVAAGEAVLHEVEVAAQHVAEVVVHAAVVAAQPEAAVVALLVKAVAALRGAGVVVLPVTDHVCQQTLVHVPSTCKLFRPVLVCDLVHTVMKQTP